MKKVVLALLAVVVMLTMAGCTDGEVAEISETTPEIETEEPTEEDLTYVSSDAEIILINIAEDVAVQIAQNPSTVDFSTLEWGFARDEYIYAVQGTFTCSNLMGVSETHVLQVWCKASEDYAKIQPYKVILDEKVLVDNSIN